MNYAREYVEFGPQHEALSVARYRELVEKRVNELVSRNPILQKINDGKSINALEAEKLADQLNDEHPHITLDLLEIPPKLTTSFRGKLTTESYFDN